MKKILKSIALLSFVAIFSVSLVACGSNDATDIVKKGIEKNKEEYKKVAELLKDGKLNDLNDLPGASMVMGMGIGDIYKDNKDALKGLGELSAKLADFDYEVSDVKEENDKITAKVKITTYDVKKLMTEAQAKMTEEIQKEPEKYQGNQSEMVRQIVAKLFEIVNENAKTKEYVKEVDVEMNKLDGNWEFSAMSGLELGKIISGGIQ